MTSKRRDERLAAEAVAADAPPADPVPVEPAAGEPEVVPAQGPPPATVRQVAGHHLVTYGTWEMTVDPAGLILLPRHVDPDHWNDFVACGDIAKDVGRDVRARNEAAGAQDDRRIPARRAIIAQGPPAPGTVRVPTQQHKSATIGRPKRRAADRNANTPRATRRNETAK